MRITRRHLQLSLAALWLLDGILQCQPFMFTSAFARSVLVPAGHGQPAVLAEPLHVAATLVLAHPALVNGAFALIQISLGLGLFVRRFTRFALAGSIAWAILVWIVGEGIGGIASGGTLLTGAPGAALLYVVIAVLAWPTRHARGDERPSRLVIPAWCALWLTGAGLQLVAGNNAASSFTKMLREAQSISPAWIAMIDHQLVRLRLPSWSPALVIALFVLVAIWTLVPGWTRDASVGIGVIIALTGWLLFQGLGDLTSGQATDPNSGPLIVLLAVAVVGATNDRKIERLAVENLKSREPIVATSRTTVRDRLAGVALSHELGFEHTDPSSLMRT